MNSSVNTIKAPIAKSYLKNIFEDIGMATPIYDPFF